ncbi:PDZ domain-containing protein [Sphingomonas sp. M1-B02]|uniref:PDZ domain-containing protein n=1 Tax=Sphingomonas sp. M1-B02 TaxID=3114300 RepID=UPI00223F9C8A|nr:PDZ domain-containing protein [Sphingomonas sp. S6-11]UZK67335.1 PDZ domain-containing protein [Sphingomonas sp. S6-11]
MMLATALALLTGLPALARDKYVYGPEPEWERYKKLGEEAVRAKLPDPQNWAVEWPNGYAQFIWFHKGKFPGYATCGLLRATVPGQGRRSVINFGIVIDYDQVKKVHISDKSTNSLTNLVCAELVSRGTLPPASVMDAPKDVSIAALGLTIRAMPEGAYVLAIGKGSAADGTGLTAGTVITKVNGIALGGLGSAMAKILESPAPTLSLETAAGNPIEIKRAL